MADIHLDFVGPGARLALAAAKAAQSAFKNLLGQGTSILAQGAAQVNAAQIAAARAEAAELVLEVTTAGGWFDSETDPELLALPNGVGAFINTPSGDFYTVEMVGGVPTRRTTFLTRYSDRHNGINLWEFAKGDGVTDDTAAVNLAFALAVGLGVGKVNCGGPGLTYLLGGPFVTLGTFTTPSGALVPFNRYKVRLYSNLEIVGQGASFKLAGGSEYVGGIFGHPWWNGERLTNVKIKGVVMDGNLVNQVTPVIPANTHDNSVWQHGNAITICPDGLEVDNCVFKNLRGHGINLNWASTSPEEWAAPINIEVHHSEFVNVFTQACNAGRFNTHFHHNLVHGDGFWVAGFDIESGSPLFPIEHVRSYKNTYEYRDGLAPPESNPQYANTSTEGFAARRHLRRAVTAFCPGDSYTGTMRDVLVEDETVYQGVMTLSRFGGMKVVRPVIRNTLPETIPDGYVSASGNCIGIEGFGWILPDCSVIDPDIESVIVGHGVVASGVERLKVRGGSVRRMPFAGVRANGCSGSISDIDVQDIGRDDSDLPADQIGRESSAVVLFGGHTSTLQVSDIRATDTRSGGARRVRHVIYANVGTSPLTRVQDCTPQNILGAEIRDVNNTLFKHGNTPPDAPVYKVSHPAVFASTLQTDGGVITVNSASGPASLALNAPAGQSSTIVMRTDGGIEFILNLTADGQLNFSTFDNGVLVSNPIAISNGGKLVILADWQHPIQIAGIGFLWMDAAQRLRVNGAAPTSDTDGVVVGTQA